MSLLSIRTIVPAYLDSLVSNKVNRKGGAWELLAVLTALSAHQLPHGDVGTAALPPTVAMRTVRCVSEQPTADSEGLAVGERLLLQSNESSGSKPS